MLSLLNSISSESKVNHAFEPDTANKVTQNGVHHRGSSAGGDNAPVANGAVSKTSV